MSTFLLSNNVAPAPRKRLSLGKDCTDSVRGVKNLPVGVLVGVEGSAEHTCRCIGGCGGVW